MFGAKYLGLFAYETLARVVHAHRRARATANNCRHYLLPKIQLPATLGLSIPFFGYNTANSTNKNKSDVNQFTIDLKQKLIEADQLFLVNKYEDVVHLLEMYKDKNNVQVLWRLSKAKYNMSLDENISKDRRKLLISSAHELIIKALDIDSNIPEVHEWAAILIDTYSNINFGIKEQLKQFGTVKFHLQKALELNPKDPFIHYINGYWCYNLADISWFRREIASIIFGVDIPTSTFEEALEYFKDAESMQPKFYCKNLLMLGKTFLKLDNKFSAEYYLKLVTQYPAKTVEDHQAKIEAEKILKSLLG